MKAEATILPIKFKAHQDLAREMDKSNEDFELAKKLLWEIKPGVILIRGKNAHQVVQCAHNSFFGEPTFSLLDIHQHILIEARLPKEELQGYIDRANYEYVFDSMNDYLSFINGTF